ncbi:MAG: superoxide dismutase family protein [Alphaproteobacteria bacterium]|nr:superoxide dismutase family protein [Alphaproteobacteria bacterium]
MKKILIVYILLTGCANHQQTLQSDVYLTEISDAKIGVVRFKDTANGLLVEAKLSNLPQGEHGFHVHENPDCASTTDHLGQIQFAHKAGAHYDPYKTNKHLGPNGGGHLGDLPYLTVDADGTVNRKFYLKNIKAQDFKNRSIMIHAGGDNYKDTPLPQGGAGRRIACGIIK